MGYDLSQYYKDVFDEPSRKNVIGHWMPSKSIHVLKLDKPVFKYQIFDPANKNNPDLIWHHINLIDFDTQGQKHIDGNAIFITIDLPYFHNVLENFSSILHAYDIDKDLIVVLNGKSLSINEETNDFYGMNDGEEDAFFNLSYVKEFLNYYDIKYLCVDSNTYRTISSDCAYIITSNQLIPTIPAYSNWHSQVRYFEPENHIWMMPFLPNLPANLDVVNANIKILNKYLPETKLDRNFNIYISRGNSKDRKIEQEEAIEKYFEDIGYRVVHFENESFFEQIKIAKSAGQVAVRHGSGLVNMLFNTENPSVAELHFANLDFPSGDPFPYHSLMSKESVHGRVIVLSKNTDEIIKEISGQLSYLKNNIWKLEKEMKSRSWKSV